MGVNLCHLWILFVKNLRLQIRNPLWLVMELALPVLLISYCILLPESKRDPSYGSVTFPDHGRRVLWTMKDGCCNETEVKALMSSLGDGMQMQKSTETEMKQQMMKPVEQEKIYGIRIEEMETNKRLKYKILTGKDYLATETSSAHGPHLAFYGTHSLAYHVNTLQYRMETYFQKREKNKYPNLEPLPRPENIVLTGEQSSFYIYCPLMFLLVIVYTARNIVSERQTIQPYLSVMGLSTTTFYLSHCIFAFVWICVFSLAHVILVFRTIPNFPWSLAIITMILFSLAATAFAAVMGCLFTNSSTTIQITISLWLAMCFTPMMVTVSPMTPTWLACAQSLWPTYALHYIFKYTFTVSDYGLGTWTQLANSQWTGQATIGPLLVLLLYPFLMVGIICIFEKKLWKKIGSLWAKRRMKSERAEEKVKLLDNSDEKFDVDEKDADIILRDVYKKYPSGVKAVNGLDMMALRGQVTVLLGHNGAGKTTTFSMICGVEEASSGSVEVGGYPAGSLESRKTIGYCAQVNTLIDQMTVKDHLWLAHGLKMAEGNYQEEAEELMETLGLENMRVKELSGGQKRKLCVAMALIGNSRVVLLDEPTAGMDPESRRDVEELLEEVKKERTILLTTHYMDEAETLGDRIFIMADGHGICSGSPQFLKKRFGTGYVLTLVAGEGSTGPELAKQMEPLVQKYAVSAKLGEIRGKQVEMSIPIEEQRHFPELFEQIETTQQDLHISSFGLSLNTLEQVFLHVCSLTDKDKSKRDFSLDDALAELYEEEKREGPALYWHQFLAVLNKKLIYTIRFWSQLVTQIGVPLLAIIVAVLLYFFGGGGQTDLVVKIPPWREMFIQNHTSTPESKYLESMGAHIIPSDQKIKDYLRQNLDKQFKLGMVFYKGETGKEMNGKDDVELYYNAIYPFAAAQAISTLSYVRSPQCNISLSFDIFDNADTTNFLATYLRSILLFFLISLTVCQLVVTMIEDRVSRFAHQQLLTGIKPTVYWLGEVAYCLMIYSIQAVIYLIALSFTGAFTPVAAMILLLMLLLYFWSTISTVFVFSRFIKSSSKGALLLWVLLFGSFTFVFIYVNALLQLFNYKITINAGETNIGRMNGLELLLFLFRFLFPSYTIVELMSTYINYSNGVQSLMMMDADPEALITLHCICLATTGAVSLVIFLLVQQRHIRYGIFRVCKARRAREWIPEEVMIPEDSIRNAPEEQAMLEVTDMSKVYGNNCVLAHLSMSVRKNEIFGLLGVNGAGKTTAFNILTGQMFATQGTATIDGIDCRKKVVLGFCPQFEAIHPLFTGREALTILARIHGYTDPEQTADRLLEIVKMTEHGKKRMGRCSGGQKRRISVAASLLTTKSPMIILDEATAGIDPKARRDIWEVITAARNHAAVLMTSHSMDECEALCNRIGILKQGGLAIVGTSQSLKSRYGNFYTLTMALPSSDMKTKVMQEVANRFPGSILKSDGFSLHLKWQVPKKPTDRWSTVFASCLELSERIGVADFCLTQSTLQDIFLLLAGDNPVSMTTASIQQPSSQTSAEPSRSRSSAPKSAEKSDVQENQQPSASG